MMTKLAGRSLYYVDLLWTLTGLFCFRVLAQPLALIIESPWFPRFNEWHSGILHYPILLMVQVFIIVAMVYVNRAYGQGKIGHKPQLGAVLMTVGILYALAMIARLLFGVRMVEPSAWMANKISPWFHLVLAAYLLTIAHFHLSKKRGSNQ